MTKQTDGFTVHGGFQSASTRNAADDARGKTTAAGAGVSVRIHAECGR